MPNANLDDVFAMIVSSNLRTAVYGIYKYIIYMYVCIYILPPNIEGVHSDVNIGTMWKYEIIFNSVEDSCCDSSNSVKDSCCDKVLTV